jgi:F-type H+-transporting ATPase subunit b
MLALIFNFLFLFAEEAHGGAPESGFMHFWNTYMNHPGLEAWKFINLGIFLLVLIYFLRTPLSAIFKAKRDLIQAELIKAQQERDAAVARLQDIEARLSSLDSEVSAIGKKSAAEAQTEKARVAAQTESDIAKIREQAQNEIARAGSQAKQELRKFSAEESIRLAEEMLRGKVNGDTDAKLVKAGIDNLGGLN